LPDDNPVDLGKVDYRQHHQHNKEETQNKAILDDDLHWDEDINSIWVNYKSLATDDKGRVADDDDFFDEEDRDGSLKLPEHPFLRVFDLKSYHWYTVHVDNVERYEYNPDLRSELVLKDDIVDIITILTENTGDKIEDVIKGKGLGTIILTSGPPGVGKTLTAEIFSELIRLPLYPIQCAQLGTTPDELESKLSNVLDNAEKWKAIVLLDEADVYIHERGNDVDQNAIVGVFLRLLEYYKGMMFLTTNRGTVVDDAIFSRCLAHIRYKNPDVKERSQIWHIMLTRYKILHTKAFVQALVERFDQISGRSIKQLCSLFSTLIKSKKRDFDVSVESFEWLSQFQNIEGVKVK